MLAFLLNILFSFLCRGKLWLRFGCDRRWLWRSGVCQRGRVTWSQSGCLRFRNTITAGHKMGFGWHLRQRWMHSEETDASGRLARRIHTRIHVIWMASECSRSETGLVNTSAKCWESHQIGQLGDTCRSERQVSSLHLRLISSFTSNQLLFLQKSRVHQRLGLFQGRPYRRGSSEE